MGRRENQSPPKQTKAARVAAGSRPAATPRRWLLATAILLETAWLIFLATMHRG